MPTACAHMLPISPHIAYSGSWDESDTMGRKLAYYTLKGKSRVKCKVMETLHTETS